MEPVVETVTVEAVLQLSPSDLQKILAKKLAEKKPAEGGDSEDAAPTPAEHPIFDNREKMIEALNAAFTKTNKEHYFMLREFVVRRGMRLYDYNSDDHRATDSSGPRQQLVANAVTLVISGEVQSTSFFPQMPKFGINVFLDPIGSVIDVIQAYRRKDVPGLESLMYLGTYAEVKERVMPMLVAEAVRLAQSGKTSEDSEGEAAQVHPLKGLKSIFDQITMFSNRSWVDFLWILRLDPRTSEIEGLDEAISLENAKGHYFNAATIFFVSIFPAMYLGLFAAAGIEGAIAIFAIVTAAVLAVAAKELIQGIITQNSPPQFGFDSVQGKFETREDLDSVQTHDQFMNALCTMRLSVSGTASEHTFTSALTKATVDTRLKQLKAAVDGPVEQPTPPAQPAV